MDWGEHACDRDMEQWENWRRGTCISNQGNELEQPAPEYIDPDGDVDMGWDSYHNDPVGDSWDH
eukprot:10264752-Heterocapsa_arctica.AAC.1